MRHNTNSYWVLQTLDKLNGLLNRILMILGGAAVLGLMALAAFNVIRRLFGKPFDGAYEWSGFLGALVIAFALGYTQKRKDNIVVDVLTERFPPRINQILDTIKYFILMIFFGVVSQQIWVWGRKVWTSGELSETTKILYFPFVFCVSIGFAVLSFTLLVDFLIMIIKPPKDLKS